MMSGILTAREREAVRLAAQGLTPAQIAERMGIQRGTVYRYLEVARRATGHATTAQLVIAMASSRALQDR